MDRLEFEAELRRDAYRVVNTSVKPNLVAPNHCHDFDAKAFVLGGEITITRDNNPVTFRAGQCFEVPVGLHACRACGSQGVALLNQADAATAAPSRVRHLKAICVGKASRSRMAARKPIRPRICTLTISTLGSWC